MARSIILHGIRHHNLKGFDLAIPHEKMVVVTGVSGSGKTSLAFDTIYAEGQRRYVESLSSYARQFLEMTEKPAVDHIEGLTPSIAIQQRGLNNSPRSIVGTTTEIYDYLRILFARAGVVHCHKCGREIDKTTPTEIISSILSFEGKKIYLMAPVITRKKGGHDALLKSLSEEGFIRVIIDKKEWRLDEEIPPLDKNKYHTIQVVIDRLSIKSTSARTRIGSSVETALTKGGGKVVVKELKSGEEKLYSEHFGCPYCDIYYDEIEPRTFSFNSPSGACQTCNGLGFKLHMDPELVVASPDKSIGWHAIPAIAGLAKEMVKQVIIHYKEEYTAPFSQLSKKVQQKILYGTGAVAIRFSIKTTNMRHKFTKPYEGVIPMLERLYRETESEARRKELEKYLVEGECDDCHGARLSKKALSVTIAEMNIYKMGEFPVEELFALFSQKTLKGFNDFRMEIGKKLIEEVRLRLGFLVKVGLGYLTLNRRTGSLSGGESQRIHLATQIGSALTGVTYVLDEPSIGLHHADTKKLISILYNLRDLGNNVIVVEHDQKIMLASDYIIDLGPGAGEKGGDLIYAGKTAGIIRHKTSLTGKYLSGKKKIPLPQKRKAVEKWIELKGVKTNNLKNISVDIPLGVLSVVTGMSGSGKSSLIMDTLIPALRKKSAQLSSLRGRSRIRDLIEIDQSPIGRTPRSNPATYTGTFTPIRELFASLPESKARGYNPGRFSFNVKGGRCERCQGAGLIRIEMNFMPDTWVTCPECAGKRFNHETLEISFKGHTIYDVLNMEVDRAVELFRPFSSIRRKLDLLHRIGLGYITLGQPAHTLSGGEAQRIKLSKELSKKRSDGSLYILDEPTTGLHFEDIGKLLTILNQLVEKGSSVLIIEHNLDVIKSADYIIDLGPGGGTHGGKIVAIGTPEQVAKNKKSFTGEALKGLL